MERRTLLAGQKLASNPHYRFPIWNGPVSYYDKVFEFVEGSKSVARASIEWVPTDILGRLAGIGIPYAYVIDVLEVPANRRGRGYGRRAVEMLLDVLDDRPILLLTEKPETERFWSHMGWEPCRLAPPSPRGYMPWQRLGGHPLRAASGPAELMHRYAEL